MQATTGPPGVKDIITSQVGRCLVCGRSRRGMNSGW